MNEAADQRQDLLLAALQQAQFPVDRSKPAVLLLEPGVDLLEAG